MNSEKNCMARRIDMAARALGVMMGISVYATFFKAMAIFWVTFAAVNAPFISYLIPLLCSCVLGTGMGMGMGLAYVRSIQVLPGWMAWFGTVWDSFFASLFYLGWVAILISLIFGPFAVVFSCALFFPVLGYRIIACRRSRRPAGDENRKD